MDQQIYKVKLEYGPYTTTVTVSVDNDSIDSEEIIAKAWRQVRQHTNFLPMCYKSAKILN